MRSAVLLAALSLAAAACGDDDDGFGLGASTTTESTTAASSASTTTTPSTTTAPDTTAPATTTPPPGERYSEETRQSYLEGCTQDAPLAACECTLAEFQRRYSEGEFVALAIDNADAAEPPAEVLEVIIACIGDLDDGSGTFPAEFREGYIEGCTAEGTIEFCTCTLDRFEEIYTLEEFTTVFTQMESEATMPPEVEAILTECISSSG
jgi:hypothetical protein